MANRTAPDTLEALMLPATDDLAACSDADLQARQAQFAAVRRRVDAGAARVAAEISRRSSRASGYAGLAQREGLRAAELLVEKLAGVTPGEARAMVRVGELLDSNDLPAVSYAVESGELSVLAADAIRAGLGEPTDTLPAETLADAAALMVDAAAHLPLRRVAAQARALRDSLDELSVTEREEQLRSRRYLRLMPQDDGMSRLTGLLDPESAALVTAAFDQVTAPRRGGPRFVDETDAARAQLISDDPRSTEQLLADAFVEMVRIAGAADPGTVFGQRRPAVSIHVDRRDLELGTGHATIEGQTVAISIDTARRHACTSGAIPILFDGADAIDVGRTQRLFTSANASLSPPATAVAGSPTATARRPGAKPTISTNGSVTTVARMSRPASFFAASTTYWSTTPDGASDDEAADSRRNHHPVTAAHRSTCPAITHCTPPRNRRAVRGRNERVSLPEHGVGRAGHAAGRPPGTTGHTYPAVLPDPVFSKNAQLVLVASRAVLGGSAEPRTTCEPGHW